MSKTINSLEVRSEVFYQRLRDGEERLVRDIVINAAIYMSRICRGPILIAGVGGILRFEDPNQAQDIDLTVVGLNYTSSRHPVTSVEHRNSGHTFDDVIAFTRTVNDYFKQLADTLGDGHPRMLGDGGSGPFARWDDSYEVKVGDDLAQVVSELESFGWFGSKGMQVIELGVRPVDIQFSFDNTPGQWRESQTMRVDAPGKDRRKGVRSDFPYAVLYERE